MTFLKLWLETTYLLKSRFLEPLSHVCVNIFIVNKWPLTRNNSFNLELHNFWMSESQVGLAVSISWSFPGTKWVSVKATSCLKTLWGKCGPCLLKLLRLLAKLNSLLPYSWWLFSAPGGHAPPSHLAVSILKPLVACGIPLILRISLNSSAVSTSEKSLCFGRTCTIA